MTSPHRPLPARGALEEDLINQGFKIAGVDEVGRGCIAGPVVAACAVLDYSRLNRLSQRLKSQLRDSKTLSPQKRREMLPVIQDIAFDCRHASASVVEIESLGIVQATFLAMRRAIGQCQPLFDLVLVDGKSLILGYEGAQKAIIKGDNLCFSIAAASIVAKEKRDELMHQQAVLHPHYGFEDHVGYGTQKHLDMVHKHGICPLHRRNFDPIRSMLRGPEGL